MLSRRVASIPCTANAGKAPPDEHPQTAKPFDRENFPLICSANYDLPDRQSWGTLPFLMFSPIGHGQPIPEQLISNSASHSIVLTFVHPMSLLTRILHEHNS